MGNGPLHTVIAEAKCSKSAQHESALTEEQLIVNADSEYDSMQGTDEYKVRYWS